MNHFVVFDFETDSVKPETCSPVQVASVVIDPNNLTIIPGSEFCSDMKPDHIDDEGYMDDKERQKTMVFHRKVSGKTTQEILDRWKAAPPQKEVWNNFVQHNNKFNPKNTKKAAPVPCGMNIRNFDLIIADRLNVKYKITKLFNYRIVDLMDMFYYSLMWDHEVNSLSMDNMRVYFGQADTNSHDALQDVLDESEFIIRYLKFFKNVFNKGNNPYKGCMKKNV